MKNVELTKEDVSLTIFGDKRLIPRQEHSHPAVYILHQLSNDRMYIGSTGDLYDRIAHHEQHLEGNKHKNKRLQKAFNEHPHFLLGFIRVDTRDKALEIEQILLDNYMSTGRLMNRAPDVYNSTKGMKLTNEEKDKLRQITIKQFESEEARDVQRQIAIKQWQDPEFRKRYEEGMANIDPEIQKARSEKLSRSAKENFESSGVKARFEESWIKNQKPIVVKGIKYPSINDAVLATGIVRGTITHRIKKQSERFPDYYFVNEEEK